VHQQPDVTVRKNPIPRKSGPMKKWLFILSAFLVLQQAPAQLKGGLEQYGSYSRPDPAVSLETLIHLQTGKNWYGEIRYNYDEPGAVSFNTGKSFSAGNNITITLTPMLGLVFGTYTGANFNFDQEVEWKRLYYSSKIQYTVSFLQEQQDFFYAWLETGYNLSRHFYGGLSMQYTAPGHHMQKGFYMGFSAGNWSFPVYFFEPFSDRSSVTLGIIYSTNFNKKE
jgi:hypothetical protein